MLLLAYIGPLLQHRHEPEEQKSCFFVKHPHHPAAGWGEHVLSLLVAIVMCLVLCGLVFGGFR